MFSAHGVALRFMLTIELLRVAIMLIHGKLTLERTNLAILRVNVEMRADRQGGRLSFMGRKVIDHGDTGKLELEDGTCLNVMLGNVSIEVIPVSLDLPDLPTVSTSFHVKQEGS